MSRFSELINGDQPVLVDFYAEWCGPCKLMPPILKEAKDKLGSAVTIIKIDIDRNQQVAQHYGIQGVPTLILFRGGQILWRQSGVVRANELVSVIRQHS